MRAPYQPVDPTIFDQPTEELAYHLLDLVLVRQADDGVSAGRIVECEMYQGPDDKGAHSFGGKPTPRTRVMYGPAGRAYVYFIYGMYYCLNVVTQGVGTPHAILIRALEPLIGTDLMAARLGTIKGKRPLHSLASGPGKLCRAMAIDRQLYGHPLFLSPLYLVRPEAPWPSYRVARGPRVNIAYAEEAAAYAWRFWVAGHPSVSRPSGPVATVEDVPSHIPD